MSAVRLSYREAVEFVGAGCSVSGGQGDWIVVKAAGPQGETEAAVNRQYLLQLASLLKAMHGYLAEREQ